MEWKALLSDFWKAFSAAIDETKELRITHVIDKLDAELGPHFFPEREDGSNPRKCLSCEDGRLGLKLGRNGGFIGCSNYPDCGYTTTLRVVTGDEDEGRSTGPKELGTDPETGLPVSIREDHSASTTKRRVRRKSRSVSHCSAAWCRRTSTWNLH